MLEESFDKREFTEKITRLNQQSVLNILDQSQDNTFQIGQCAFNSSLNDLVPETESAVFGYRHSTNSETNANFDHFSIPTLFHTLGEHDEDCSKPFKLSDEAKFGIDQRASVTSQPVYWMQVQVCVQGALMHELFIKNLTLTLNQSIFDCMIELYLDRNFVTRPLQASADEFKLKLHQMQSSEPTASIDSKSLSQLMKSSIAAHSPVSERFVSDLSGQVSEINQNFSFAVLRRLHKFLRDEAINEFQAKLAQAYDGATIRKIVNTVISLI